MQHCYEWHRSFALEAISAVAAHWKTDTEFEDPGVRIAFINRVCLHSASPPMPFIWESYDVLDPSKKVIVSTLGHVYHI